MSVARVIILGGALLAAGLVARGQERAPALDPAARVAAEIEQGLEWHRVAEQTNAVEVVVNALNRALEHYQRAAELAPDRYQAQFLWGLALGRLGLMRAEPAAARRLLEQAGQRFAVAERCPDREPMLYLHWSALILDRGYLLAPAAHQPAQLAAAEQLLRRGLEAVAATDTTVRVRLQANLGRCLLRRAMNPAFVEPREPLLREAVALFAEPALQPVLAANPIFGQLAGVALLKLGVAERNPELIEAAAQRLQGLLAIAPRAWEHRYNLACALTQLERFDEALAQLRIAFDNDQQGLFLRSAESDPDLGPLRATAAYRELVADRLARAQQAHALGLVREAQEWQAQAAATNDLAVAAQALRKALAPLEEALRLQPDLYEARWLEGVVARDVAGTINDPRQRKQWLDRAVTAWRAAAASPAATAAVFEALAGLLTGGYHSLFAAAPEQIAVLEEARAVCERGLRGARFSGERARLNAHWGSALVLQALLLKDPRPQTGLLREAATRFEAATAADRQAENSGLYVNWGVALLKLGQHTQDKLLVRRATERFQTAIDRDPDNLAAHYNLACAFAALGQAETAMRHLSVCLARDEPGTYRQAALTDPDFDAIRHTAAYRAVFGEPPRLDRMIEPRISGR